MDTNSNSAPGDGAAGQPEGGQQQGGRPDGLPQDVVERSYFDAELTKEREKRKRQREEYEAKLAEYEARTKAEKSERKRKDEPAEDAAMQRVRELEHKLEQRDREERRARAVDAALGKVPEGNRELAQDVIDAMFARGDLDQEVSADKVVAALRKRRPALFDDPTQRGPRSAPQRRPDGSVDWRRFNHISEVPRDLVKDVPDEEWKRMRSGSAGGGSTI